MNQTLKTFGGRIACLALVLLLVLTAFVGCGSGKSATLTVGTIAADTDNSLSAEQLTRVASMLASVYSSDFNTQEMLVAASRGYDMTIQGFDDTKEEFPDQGVNLTAVKTVITKANEKAKDDKKVEFDYASINEADVRSLINAFRAEVDLESAGGFFDVILVAIGAVLSWITRVLGFGNYLVGICIFAILIEILMLPFAIKQQKNTIRQAKLRPKEMAIRNKYKGRNDQATMQKMQQEIQEFYQRENYSPYSGCLPLLVQFPIIIALYNIVIDPLHYVLGQTAGLSQVLTTYATAARAAGGAGLTLSGNSGTIAILSKIKDGVLNPDGLKNFAFFSGETGAQVVEKLEAIVPSIPDFTIGSVNFGMTPSFSDFNILLLVPVLTFVAYFITSKLNRKLMYQPATNEGADAKQVACSNTMMDVSMPMMSTFFTFMMPALIGIYWIFRSLIGLLKQFIVSRFMPLPTFTEEDYKQAEKEMKGKKVVVKSANAGKVRSLHHIDDEDFDDTRERALARKAAIEERERAEQEQKAKGALFGAAPMKEENKKHADRDGEKNDSETDQDKK